MRGGEGEEYGRESAGQEVRLFVLFSSLTHPYHRQRWSSGVLFALLATVAFVPFVSEGGAINQQQRKTAAMASGDGGGGGDGVGGGTLGDTMADTMAEPFLPRSTGDDQPNGYLNGYLNDGEDGAAKEAKEAKEV